MSGEFSGKSTRNAAKQQPASKQKTATAETAKVLPEMEKIFALATERGLRPKRWGSRRLKVYNGFDHDQRVRKWQALDLAVKMGLEDPASCKPCAICGITEPEANIAYHSEDYGSMNGHHALCKSCHIRIHRRFSNPDRWQQFISPFADETQWFERLSMVDGVLLSDQPLPVTKAEKPDSATSELSLPKISAPVHSRKAKGSVAEMQQIRIDFIKALGIKATLNPDPKDGYKRERDAVKRKKNLQEAKRLRDCYAELVAQTGRNQNILDKMDSNLENRNRGTVWR